MKNIDSAEFAEWQAYYLLEPFGEYRADVRNALLACVIANSNRGKSQRSYKIKDFMPVFGPPRRQSASDQRAVWEAFVSAHNQSAGR